MKETVNQIMARVEKNFWERKRQEYKADFEKAIRKVFMGDVHKKSLKRKV